MKSFSLGLCFLLFFSLFLSCERENYDDEIRKIYREAKRDSTSGVVIDGNMWSAHHRLLLGMKPMNIAETSLKPVITTGGFPQLTNSGR